jgi:hypothetical protein
MTEVLSGCQQCSGDRDGEGFEEQLLEETQGPPTAAFRVACYFLLCINWGFLLLIYFFGSTRACSQGLMFPKQPLYHLNHSTSLVLQWVFSK